MEHIFNFLTNLLNKKMPGISEMTIQDYIISMVMTVIFTYGIIYIIRFFIHQFFIRTNFIEEKKEETIESVIQNTSHYVAFFIIVISAIQPFFDLKQLLVAGGVIGIVIGFGAQSSIRDILHGFFFLFEGQFKKGDFVQINGEIEGGVVEELGFRAVKVRLVNGKLMTISNGEVRKVVNGNIEKRRVFESVIVSFRENPSKIKSVLEEVCEELNEKQLHFLKKNKETGEYIEPYRVFGLSSLDSNVLGYKFNICATIKDTEYIAAVQEAKEVLAQKIYDSKIKMPEHHVYHRKTHD